jgi:2OG-Fe(II) oxygenase superfamily
LSLTTGGVWENLAAAASLLSTNLGIPLTGSATLGFTIGILKRWDGFPIVYRALNKIVAPNFLNTLDLKHIVSYENSLGKNNTIASLSFGAERKFSFKHKQTKQTVSLVLEHGSLLIMKDATQRNWLHSLPKSKNITQPRINLTFRTIREPQ